jgi:hypothetical protein
LVDPLFAENYGSEPAIYLRYQSLIAGRESLEGQQPTLVKVRNKSRALYLQIVFLLWLLSTQTAVIGLILSDDEPNIDFGKKRFGSPLATVQLVTRVI